MEYSVMSIEEAMKWIWGHMPPDDNTKQSQAMLLALNALSHEAQKTVGKWIEHEYADIVDGRYVSNYECPCCHEWVKEKTAYCPHCGGRVEV